MPGCQPDKHGSDLANRIFHVRSKVDFSNLRDNRITLNLTLLNASNETIVSTDIKGSITYANFPQAGIQPSPQLGRPKTNNEPLQEFEVVLEQHVSKELAEDIDNYLCSRRPLL
jgi:hypothetical protein